jgi:hypothetical protein
MGVFRRLQSPEMSGRNRHQDHPGELFGGGRHIFQGASGGDAKKGRVQLG